MHERNPYARPPDFARLCATHADLRPHCKLVAAGKVHLDFSDDAAVRALTRALLKEDFGLDVELPTGSLCPRVPQRLNYLLWIEDVIVASGLDADAVRGIDIGTGASCIYALLGARRLGWRFAATEADDASCEVARRNVSRNGLTECVEVVKTAANGTIIEDLVTSSALPFTFCMCNPPFFDGDGETGERFVERGEEEGVKLEGGRRQWENGVSGGKRPLPRSGTVAAENELATEGGEVAFVGRMIEESARMKEKVRFYTTMLGKKRSVGVLMERLRRVAEDDKRLRFTSGELRQGRTQRWLLLWTWDERVRMPVRAASLDLVMPQHSREQAWQWIRQQLVSLRISSAVREGADGGSRLECAAEAPTWLRRGRKGKRTKMRAAKESLDSARSLAPSDQPCPLQSTQSLASSEKQESRGSEGTLHSTDWREMRGGEESKTTGPLDSTHSLALSDQPVPPFPPLTFTVTVKETPSATYTLAGATARLSMQEGEGERGRGTVALVFSIEDDGRKRELAQLVVHLGNKLSGSRKGGL